MKLRVLDADGRPSREIPLNERRITIGSAPDNTIVLTNPTVSKYHAAIHLNGRTCSVVDLRSTNGTFIRGARIGGSAALIPGDEVRIGAVRCELRREARDYRGIIAKLLLAFAGLFIASFVAVLFFSRRSQPPAIRFEVTPAASPVQALAAQPVSSVGEPSAANVASSSGSTATPAVNEMPAASAWLAPLNAYRAAAGVPPVIANPKFSFGDFLHSRYIVKNYGGEIAQGVNLGPTMHTEDISKPWYTAEGFEAAKAGDVDEMWDPDGIAKPSWAIDDWMLGPFHRLSLLDPHLHNVGYGYFCAKGVCVAALNVHGDTRAMQATTPMAAIKYPPEGGVISRTPFAGEWPDPLTSCSGYQAPAGYPITLQLGAVVAPVLSSYELTRDSAKVESCGFDAHTYTNPDPAVQQLTRQILLDYGAAVIIPREPLKPGKYKITLGFGDQNYSWSFAVK